MSEDSSQKKILFLICTEYALLMSYLYYLKYKENTGVKPIFVYFKSNPKRLRGIDFNALPGDSLLIVNNLNESILFPDKSFKTILNYEGIEEIVFQNPYLFLNSIVIKKYKKIDKSCKLTLIADSAAIDRTFPFSIKLNVLSKLYFRKIFNGIKNIPWKVWTNQNISSKIDLLIARRNIGVKQLIDTNSLLESIPNNINKLDKLFNFNLEVFNESELIYFTQPVQSQAFDNKYKIGYNNVTKIISDLALKYKKKIIFKIHPGEDKSEYLKYENKFVSIDSNSNVPAEIIINGLNDKIIVSFWSAISLFDVNHKNKHYWLYKTIDYPLNSVVKYDFISNVEDLSELEKILFDNKLL